MPKKTKRLPKYYPPLSILKQDPTKLTYRQSILRLKYDTRNENYNFLDSVYDYNIAEGYEMIRSIKKRKKSNKNNEKLEVECIATNEEVERNKIENVFENNDNLENEKSEVECIATNEEIINSENIKNESEKLEVATNQEIERNEINNVFEENNKLENEKLEGITNEEIDNLESEKLEVECIATNEKIINLEIDKKSAKFYVDNCQKEEVDNILSSFIDDSLFFNSDWDNSVSSKFIKKTTKGGVLNRIEEMVESNLSK